jgi:hypothetical protein
MKMPTVLRICTILCAVFILNSCQKEISTTKEQLEENGASRTSGVIDDDPGKVAKVPTIMSSAFYSLGIPARGPRPTSSKKDTDGDGIADATDICPKEKETMNGYQDTDGCPDIAPPSTNYDTVGDGKADSIDACPAQAETFNGYLDNDGCPDVLPDTDGDGIPDGTDSCPAEAEIVNGYMDEDGCPDTPPIVLPPATVPASFQLATPAPGNQGNEGSCVAFAIAYAARSIEQYYTTNANSYSSDVNVFSPEYVYNQTKFGECGSGTAITVVLDLIQNQGVSVWQLMPYSDVNGCSLMPNTNQTTNASGYKISSYAKIANTDAAAIKAMIAAKHPVIVTIIADDSFVNAKAGFIWKTYSGSGALPHTLTICGYDDAKHAYKVMNSWGNGWGDAGFSWIDYDLLPQKSSFYTYVIQ